MPSPWKKREPLIPYPWGWIILVVIIFSIITTLYFSHPVAQFPTGRVNVTCTEDMKCWDCHTMGNHICGPGHE